jgi:dTMP kinase
MQRARFITFEGGEGSGKTTQIQRLIGRLKPLVGEVVTTREPGGSTGAEQIRYLLVNGPPERWSAETETLLMYAARRDHIERFITPALRAGAWVVCDRFHDSTRAYQGAAGGAPAALIDALEHTVLDGLKPDLTLILDIPVDIGLARAAKRDDGEARFEAKGHEFHERLRQAYLQIARREPDRCATIDANGGVDEIEARIWSAVSERLGVAA